MGKASKYVVPVAIAAATIYTGGAAAGAWGAGSTAGFTTAGGVTFGPGAAASMSAGGGATFGSFFSGLSAYATPANASLLLSGVSAVSSVMGGLAGAQQSNIAARAEEERARMARLQALQLEAQALKSADFSKSNAIAKAASMKQNLSGRSFLAFVQDQENETEKTISSIQVNAESSIKTSNLRLRQYASEGVGALIGGAGGATRSLLTAAVARG